jgi:hypothetical protein
MRLFMVVITDTIFLNTLFFKLYMLHTDYSSNTADYSSNTADYSSNTADYSSNTADYSSNTADYSSNNINAIAA